MASFSAMLGRLALFALITTQSMFLSAYLANYEGKSNWYFMVISFVPAVVVWIWKSFKSLSLRWLFRIWGLYVVALVVNIAMVVVLVGDRISKTEFLSPNALKAILCITPILLLLLLNTGDLNDSHGNYKETEIVSYLCLPMTVDLSVRWNRDDRYRVRSKRVRLWNTQSIQCSDFRVGLPRFYRVGISLAHGRN